MCNKYFIDAKKKSALEQVVRYFGASLIQMHIFLGDSCFISPEEGTASLKRGTDLCGICAHALSKVPFWPQI